MGIGTIEAAQHLANNPEEGEGHEGFTSDYARTDLAANEAIPTCNGEPLSWPGETFSNWWNRHCWDASSFEHDSADLAWKAATIAARPATEAREERESLPENCDVRKILLRVVPGDGSGHEVYAKDIADVEQLLSEMGERIENFESNRAALPAGKVAAEPVAPVGGREAWEKVLSFSRRIVALLDTTDVIRSTVSGTAYDAAERAVFIRNIATEALSALQPAQPTQAAQCSLGCGDECKADLHGCLSECPSPAKRRDLLAAHNGGKHD
jgi:hypothetical protein